MKVKYIEKAACFENKRVTLGRIYDAEIKEGFYQVNDDEGEITVLFHSEVIVMPDQSTDQHYNNTNGSLYKFAQDHELNAWEFDILKRIVRCRKKGQFTEDLEKTKRVIDLYLKEFEA
jgi:hypothetical protein